MSQECRERWSKAGPIQATLHRSIDGVSSILEELDPTVFDNTCSPTDATPCTIPPATFFTLTVTVVPG